MVLLHDGDAVYRLAPLCFRTSGIFMVFDRSNHFLLLFFSFPLETHTPCLFSLLLSVLCEHLYLIAPFSGIISGAILIPAATVVGAMWIVFGFLWLGLVALGALLIFLVRDCALQTMLLFRFYLNGKHDSGYQFWIQPQIAHLNK